MEERRQRWSEAGRDRILKGRECDRLGDEGGFCGTEGVLEDFRLNREGTGVVCDFIGAIGCSPMDARGGENIFGSFSGQ